MKNSIKNINQLFQIAAFCILFSLPLMSFQTNSTFEVCELKESTCPVAFYSVENNGCEGPCPISFTNQSIEAVSYHWDFGDGHISCDENPVHTYESAGTYTVTLRAIGIGCTHEFIGTVDVIDG